jgi:hypothetical protein
LDLRLSATAYDFNIGTAVYGWRTGAELTTRNGFFPLKYEYGRDKLNGSYNTIGGYVNVGFSLEDIFKGESPFSSPEPVFGSPRSLRRLLGLKVRRKWYQPAAVVLSRSSLIPTSSSTSEARRLVLVHIFTTGKTVGTFIPDEPNNSWSLSVPAQFTSCSDVKVIYVVKVSDDSLTELTGLLTPPEGKGLANNWSDTGLQSAGPTLMSSSPQNLGSLATFGHHHVRLNKNDSRNGTVIISSTDPSRAPLIINFTVSAPGKCGE